MLHSEISLMTIFSVLILVSVPSFATHSSSQSDNSLSNSTVSDNSLSNSTVSDSATDNNPSFANDTSFASLSRSLAESSGSEQEPVSPPTESEEEPVSPPTESEPKPSNNADNEGASN